MRDYEPQKMKQVKFTGIRRVLEKANAMEAAGRPVIHFEVGQPDFVTPKYIIKAAQAALEAGQTSYTSNYGTLPFRRAIADKLKRQNGLEVDPATEIMVTVGGEEAMAAAVLALLDAGDEVLLSDPGYSPYASMVKIANAVPVYVPLLEADNFNYDLAALEKKITGRSRLLILCSPANPTGTMMDRAGLLKLAEICQKHDLLVIADEAYEMVVYDDNEHISFAGLPGMRERTVTIQSFSKSYSMCGWRLGYIAAVKELLQIIVRAHQNMVLSACNFAQAAGLAALTGPQDDYRAMLAEFDRRRTLMYEGFVELGIPCNKPQAAFYLFPNVSQFGLNGSEFAGRLLDEHGVAAVPGVEFGPNGRDNIRISYATSLENCREGMRRIGEFVARLRAE